MGQVVASIYVAWSWLDCHPEVTGYSLPNSSSSCFASSRGHVPTRATTMSKKFIGENTGEPQVSVLLSSKVRDSHIDSSYRPHTQVVWEVQVLVYG